MKPSTRLALIAVALVAAFAHGLARADTNLPMVATDAACAGKSVNTVCGGRDQVGQVYKTPSDTDLVRIHPGKTAADWNSPTYLWAFWKDLSPGDLYDACKSNVAQGESVPGGTCTDWGMIAKAGPRAPVFTVAPSSGRAPLAVTITWDVDQGDNCQAGGAWSGAKARTGSQQVTLQAGTAQLTLACTRPTGPAAAGQALLRWNAPTQNTDGTPYNDPAGYQIYTGTSSPPQVKGERIAAPGTLTRTITGLPANTVQYFSITAVSAAGNESDPMGPVWKWIANTPTAQAWSGSQSVTVQAAPAPTRPKAPTLTVE